MTSGAGDVPLDGARSPERQKFARICLDFDFFSTVMPRFGSFLVVSVVFVVVHVDIDVDTDVVNDMDIDITVVVAVHCY